MAGGESGAAVAALGSGVLEPAEGGAEAYWAVTHCCCGASMLASGAPDESSIGSIVPLPPPAYALGWCIGSPKESPIAKAFVAWNPDMSMGRAASKLGSYAPPKGEDVGCAIGEIGPLPRAELSETWAGMMAERGDGVWGMCAERPGRLLVEGEGYCGVGMENC